MRKSFIVVLFASLTAMLVACSSKSGNDPTNEPTVEQPTDDPGTGAGVAPGNEQPGNTDPGTNNPPPDAGNDVTPKDPTNAAECIAVCETNHPTAAADNHELDNTCFYGDACGTVCNNLGQGESKYPDAVSGAACNTAASGSYPIGTPSQACSNCLATTPACCTLWIKIFGSAEGQSLNKCAHDCWTKFP